MKKFKRIALSVVAISFFNCSTDEEINVDDNQISTPITSTNLRTSSCDTCSDSSYPGKYFDSALSIMDLEYEIDEGENETSESNPQNESACKDYFTTCRTWMILLSGDEENDRTELKTESQYNFDLDSNARMQFSAQLQNVPTDGDDDEDGITIAQIHNRGIDNDDTKAGRPLARVAASAKSGKVYLIISETYIKGGGTKDPIEVVDFKDGDILKVIIRVRNGGFTLSVLNKSMNGNGNNFYWKNHFDTPEDWEDADGTISDSYYFKTGIYNQASGKETRMTYSQLFFENM